MGLRRFAAALGLAALVGCASAPKPELWAGGSTAEFRAEAESYGVPSLSASTFQAYGVFNPVAVLRYSELGVSPREAARFVDTEKPNAVAIFPLADDGEFFYSEGFADLIAQLREAYDLSVAVVDDERAAVTAIRAVPDVSLLAVAGHGTKDSLALGARNPAIEGWSISQEQQYIDLTDDDLFRVLRDTLRPDATILYISCSTGEGRENTRNLVNRTRKMTGLRVVGADSLVNIVEVQQEYPVVVQLKGCIVNLDTGLDCWDATYIPK